MSETEMESGRVEYEARAFHQDASSAMRGDVVRGLIELITNSDDAYAAQGSSRPGSPGKIIVEVERRRGQASRIIVRDRATGMRKETMKERLTTLGGRTSGFESGEDRRGNLGRGAKDLAAFGDTTFTSVCDGFISKLVLHPDGSYDISKRESKVRQEERKELGIRHSGTVVQVDVQPGITTVHRHDKMKQKLSTHYQLRDILSDPCRKVELVNLNRPEETDPLVYVYPSVEVVFDEPLTIPGCESVAVHLTIWRHPARCEEGPENPGRPTGVLIKGRRAIYENTLFAFEGNVNAAWFSGKLVCSHLDELARQYDDAQEEGLPLDPENPMPIISRQRDGLERDHPFVRALRQTIEVPLGKFVAEEAERARQQSSRAESDSTKKALARLGRALSRLFDDEMKEIEADEPPGDGEGRPPLLAVVPDQAYAYIGEDRTLSVHARADGLAVGDRVAVQLDPPGVVDLLADYVELKAHPRREDVLIGQLRFRPLLEGEAVIITCETSGRSANAYVEVKGLREVEPIPVEQPEGLEFERSRYRIGHQRKKTVTVIAPVDVIAEHGETIRVDSSNPQEVVVRGGTVDLHFDDSRDYYVGSVSVEARALHAEAKLTAKLGPEVATANVVVTRQEEGPSIRVKIEPTEWGPWRAVVEKETTDAGEEVQVIKIAGKHPGIKPYLGENHEGADSYVCRTIIAEVAADAVARQVVEKLYTLRQGIEMFDATRLYREHYTRMRRFLPICYRESIGDIARAKAAVSDEPSFLTSENDG